MALLPPFFYTALNSFFYSRSLLDKLQSYINAGAGLKLLDAGCGTGMLRDICRPCEYTGIELEPARVEQLKRQDFDGEIICGSLLELPFAGESFDVVLVAGVLHHLPDEACRRAMTEIFRVLRRGGKAIVFEPIWPLNRLNLFGYFIQYFDDGKFVRNTGPWRELITGEGNFKIAREEEFYYRGLDSYISMLIKE